MLATPVQCFQPGSRCKCLRYQTWSKCVSDIHFQEANVSDIKLEANVSAAPLGKISVHTWPIYFICWILAGRPLINTKIVNIHVSYVFIPIGMSRVINFGLLGSYPRISSYHIISSYNHIHATTNHIFLLQGCLGWSTLGKVCSQWLEFELVLVSALPPIKLLNIFR